MRKVGLVMEVRGKTAIVMTPEGQFCRTAAKPDWGVGMEVEFYDGAKQRQRGRRRIPAWQKSLAAASAACLVLVGGLWAEVQNHHVPKAYAYVSLDINPSIEYTLNQSGKVLRAEGLNTDGQNLLKKFHPKGEPLQQALDQTIQTAATANMLPQGDTILVTAAPGSHANVDSLRQEAQSDVEKAITTTPSAATQHPVVYSLSVTGAVWQVADKMKISPGKLVAYLVANNSGDQVTMQDLSGPTLNQVLTSPQSKSVLQSIDKKNVSEIEGWLKQDQKKHIVPVADKQNHGKQSGENNSSNGQHKGNSKTKTNSASKTANSSGNKGSVHGKKKSASVKNATTGDTSTRFGSLGALLQSFENRLEGSGSWQPSSTNNDAAPTKETANNVSNNVSNDVGAVENSVANSTGSNDNSGDNSTTNDATSGLSSGTDWFSGGH